MIHRHEALSLILNRPLFAHATTAMTVYNILADRSGFHQAPVPVSEDAAQIAHHIQSMPSRELVSRPNRTEWRGSIGSSRFEGEMVNSEDGNWRRVEPYLRSKDGTAIISITGSLVNRGAYVGAQSGVTSYEGISFQLTRAAKDPKVHALLLDISSPGGESMGNTEVAEQIHKIRKEKPVFGIANSLSASAGYAILSACTEAFGTPSSLVGSIGCIMLLMDLTEKAKNEGITPTLITAGEHKADGHPLTQLTPGALAELKAGVNSYYELFANVVGKGRGSKLTAAKARKTEARTFIGRDSIEAGLIDDIGTFDDVLKATDALGKRKAKSGGNRAQGPSSMSLLTAAHDADQGTGQQQAAPQPQQQPQQAAPQPQQQPQQAAPQPQPQAPAGPPVWQQIQAHAAVRANPAMLGPCLDLHAKAPSMSAEDVVSFVSSMQPQQPAPQQAAPQPAPQPQPVPQQTPTQNLQQRAETAGVQQVPASQQHQNGPATGSQQPGSITTESAPWGGFITVQNARANAWPKSHHAPDASGN